MKYCCYARNTTDQALLQSQLELAFENTRSHGNLMVRTHHQLPFLFFFPPLNYVPFVVLSPGARCALQIAASHQVRLIFQRHCWLALQSPARNAYSSGGYWAHPHQACFGWEVASTRPGAPWYWGGCKANFNFSRSCQFVRSYLTFVYKKKKSGSAILSTKMQLVEHSPPEHTKKAKLLGSIQAHFSLLWKVGTLLLPMLVLKKGNVFISTPTPPQARSLLFLGLKKEQSSTKPSHYNNSLV